MKFYYLVILLFSGNILIGQCLSGWKFMAPVTVNNSLNPEALSDYSLLVELNTSALIGQGKMQASGADIRFVSDTSSCTVLGSFIESGINTTMTKLWVKVPVIPAKQSMTIWLLYGNPTALDISNGEETFTFFDGFDFPPIKFTDCGVPSNTLKKGQLTIHWSNAGLASVISDSVFKGDIIYTAEMNVISSTGSYPAIAWYNKKDGLGYSLYANGLYAGIGKSNVSGVAFCHPINFASPTSTATSVEGIWGITWKETGAVIADFPTVATIFSLDNSIKRKGRQRLCVGTVGNGEAELTLDWIRARKFTEHVPVVDVGEALPD